VSQTEFLDFLQNSVWLMILLSAPILVISMVLGIVISIFQAVTQIQEQTLTFVPKILTCFVVFVVTAPWMLDLMLNYTRDLFNSLVTFAH
jgi:flagellar biosynthetic protein FliQ